MMIEKGDRVRITPREHSPPSLKYAGRTRLVTMTCPSVLRTTPLRSRGWEPGGVDTGFCEEALEEE